MNWYELICLYCDHSWQVNYKPDNLLYCSKCKDTNIRVKQVDKVDQYAGSPPFIDIKNWNF